SPISWTPSFRKTPSLLWPHHLLTSAIKWAYSGPSSFSPQPTMCHYMPPATLQPPQTYTGQGLRCPTTPLQPPGAGEHPAPQQICNLHPLLYQGVH
ncbi:hypothetical protein AX15_007524, partial [Amanita polypyramis BW_CC]